MKKLKKDLQAVEKTLKSLVITLGKIQSQIYAIDKPRAAKRKSAKKAPSRKALAKKTGQVTTADTVLAIINSFKKGVNTESLMKKTGYNQKKIANVIYKLKKQGKIKSAGKGAYVKA